jgi:hypothetical protein
MDWINGLTLKITYNKYTIKLFIQEVPSYYGTQRVSSRQSIKRLLSLPPDKPVPDKTIHFRAQSTRRNELINLLLAPELMNRTTLVYSFGL